MPTPGPASAAYITRLRSRSGGGLILSVAAWAVLTAASLTGPRRHPRAGLAPVMLAATATTTVICAGAYIAARLVGHQRVDQRLAALDLEPDRRQLRAVR